MDTIADGYPVNVQEALISASLNAGILYGFLMGMYTMVYAGTMYIYISKKPGNSGRLVVLSTISVLYLVCMGVLVIEWYYLDIALVTDGDTRASIFISSLDGMPTPIYVFNDFLFLSVFIISDGLLIWRCYHVWDMSIRVVLIPIGLLLAELGLLIVITVMSAVNSQVTSEALTVVIASIITAQVIASLATTIIATSLIGYKIHSASRLTRAASKGQFAHVVTIIFESAAAYSLAILIYAIIQALPSDTVPGTPIFNGSYYVESLVTAVAGMAPTILVARIALTSTNTAVAQTVTHISGLQFQSQEGSGRSGSSSEEYVDAPIEEGGVAPQDEEKRIQ